MGVVHVQAGFWFLVAVVAVLATTLGMLRTEVSALRQRVRRLEGDAGIGPSAKRAVDAIELAQRTHR
jgi:hypothetical protein